MRHYKKGRKLGTDASHTKAIKKNLVVNLFLNDRVKTTLERAKEVRGDVDRVITWAKRGDVHSRRLAIAKLGNKDLVAEIFSKVAQGMYEGRPGGYSRILRLGPRCGDGATIVIMELVQEPVTKKSAAAAGEGGAAKGAKGAGAKGTKGAKDADAKGTKDAKDADAKGAAKKKATKDAKQDEGEEQKTDAAVEEADEAAADESEAAADEAAENAAAESAEDDAENADAESADDVAEKADADESPDKGDEDTA
jgi:large subunit ribosomal protein L17